MVVKLLQLDLAQKANKLTLKAIYNNASLSKDTFTPSFKSSNQIIDEDKFLHGFIFLYDAQKVTEEAIIAKIEHALANGAELDKKNCDGKTVLYYACRDRLNKVRDFLLKKGADPKQLVTPFEDIPYEELSKVCELSERDKAEAKEAGLLELYPFFDTSNTYRNTYFWMVNLFGEKLPFEKALTLYRKVGNDIQHNVQNFVNEEHFRADAKNGVHYWRVETKEGLKALAETLKEHFTSIGLLSAG